MVVVEGYMDVIALAAHGIEDVVAPLGTALTERQIELLWRMVPVPILCFDGDAAGQRAAIRAISRTLPLLRPGHSLAIVRLPAGMDPDDLVKQHGKAAMEKLLAEAKSLLETLWEHERDALELKTPEDKAGLRARLIEHCEAITDNEIKALYRRDLLDRFYAYAFPKREFTPRRGGQFKPAAPGLTQEARQRLQAFVGGGSRNALARAVIAGLARHPDQIDRHAEDLGKLTPDDLQFASAIDVLLDASYSLETGGEMTISALGDFAVAPDNNRFTFLSEGSDPHCAHEDLAEAVAILVEGPALEAALGDATRRFEETFEQEAYEEQQRLRKRKLEFDRRLGQMASERAASTAQTDISSPGSPETETGEQEAD